MKLTPLYAQTYPKTFSRLLFVSGFFSLALLIVLHRVDVHLRTTAAPLGIISFELAPGFYASQQMVQSWDAVAKMYAAFSLGIDYLFMISYALFLSLLCMLFTRKFSEKRILFNAGILISYGLWLAALLDAVENYALFRLLFGSSNTFYPTLASASASIKFTIILLSLIFILYAGIELIINKNKTA